MLPMIILCHSIYYGIHLEIFFLLPFSFTYNFSLPFSFLFIFVSLNVHPSPAIHRLATIVNEAVSYYRRDNPFQGRQEVYPWYL